MSIAVDSSHQQQHLAAGAGAFTGNEHPQMRFYPQFTNPWQSSAATTAAPTAASTFAAAANNHNGNTGHVRQQSQPQMQFQSNAMSTAMSMPSQGTYSTGSFSIPAQIDSPLQGFMARGYSSDFGNAPLHVYGTQPNMVKPDAESYGPTQPQIRSNSFAAFADRRVSHPSVNPSMAVTSSPAVVDAMSFTTTAAAAAAAAPLQNSSSLDFLSRLHSATEAERNSFSDALDASRGMVAMSQDITPRNIYDVQRQRAGTEAYGFPATHSSHSSFSSSSGFPGYYGGSISEASYGGYSSATESVASGRSGYSNSYMGSISGAPQTTMMGQFSSKVNSSSQKKHKCKICDKRFTRPSSLQTHMYSHTGEKPFACDVEGCGRQFSVVSNLRRHRKVHRGEGDANSMYSDADD